MYKNTNKTQTIQINTIQILAKKSLIVLKNNLLINKSHKKKNTTLTQIVK